MVVVCKSKLTAAMQRVPIAPEFARPEISWQLGGVVTGMVKVVVRGVVRGVEKAEGERSFEGNEVELGQRLRESARHDRYLGRCSDTRQTRQRLPEIRKSRSFVKE